MLNTVRMFVARIIVLTRRWLRAAQAQPEMTMGPCVRVAVDTPAVPVSLRVNNRRTHPLRLAWLIVLCITSTDNAPPARSMHPSAVPCQSWSYLLGKAAD